MRHASLYAYQLPMRNDGVLRQAATAERVGLLVHLREGAREGWGEIAPLPGFSRETTAQAQQQTLPVLEGWLRGQWRLSTAMTPSVAFGLSCALAEWRGDFPSAADWRSAVLWTDFDRLPPPLPPDIPLKLKVAQREPEAEAAYIHRVLRAFPAVALRLDANRRWSLSEAQQFAAALTPSARQRIQFIEEPCRTAAESLAFARQSGLRLAWDESAREADFDWQPDPAVGALIIKPTLTGSLNTVRHWQQRARRTGWQPVISSALESSLGLTQLARLAHGLTPDAVPGLDTLNRMAAQLLRLWPGCAQPLWGVEHLEVVWTS